MGFEFYFSTAMRNIRHGKKQSVLYVLGIFLSVSLLISLRLWSSTAEDLAARDFLENQDFEMKVTTYLPEELPYIVDWLNTDPLVSSTFKMYYNLVCFNAENKAANYQWSPEDDQEDMDDPISITAIGMFPKSALKRIQSQFYVRGSYDIGLNECLISEFEAAELERVYGYPIEPGMNVTLSLARNSPERSQVFIHQLQLKHYYNITIKGIYRPIPTISMLQKTFSASFLKDSVIFLSENIDDITILEMKVNGIEPAILVKTNVERLKEDGIDQIINKMDDLADRLKIAFRSSQYIILDSPTKELLQSYSLAQSAVIFMIPVVATSVILMLFTNNIVIEKRKTQLLTFKDRGGQNWQITSIVLLEFVGLALVAIILGIVASFFIASFIPTIASGSFSPEVFREFLANVSFPGTLTLYTIVLTLLLTTIFTILKLRTVLATSKQELEQTTRKNFFKTAGLVVISATIVIFTVILVIYSIQSYRDTKDVYNFTIGHSRKSMTIFLIILFLIILLSGLLTIILTDLLKRIKRFYNRLFIKNSFFVNNTFSQSKHTLTSLLLIFILVTSFNVFSLSLYKSITSNEQAEAYYNNGADLRIHTTFVDSTFSNNISKIDGVHEVMAVLKADGKLIYNDVTVYGIDPMIYSRIGRWDTARDSQQDISTIMRNLNNNYTGAIISDYVANRLNLTIGSQITVTGLPNSSYVENFIVQGVIHSAPGLGLAYGLNIELNQPNQEFLLINERTMREKYGIVDTNLIMASLKYDYSLANATGEIMALSEVIDVNPKIINQQFVGKFISLYIPDVKTFLIIQIILMNIIGLIIIALNTEFILKQRDRHNAILRTLGNSNNNLFQIIFSEIIVIEIVSFFVALVIGIGFSIISIYINRPSFVIHNILPLQYNFDFIGIPIFLALTVIITFVASIPLLVRFARKNTAVTLRGY